MDSHIGAESVASSTQDIGALRYSGLPLGKPSRPWHRVGSLGSHPSGPSVKKAKLCTPQVRVCRERGRAQYIKHNFERLFFGELNVNRSLLARRERGHFGHATL